MVRERKTEIRIRRARVSDAASISSVMYESFVEYKSLYTDEAFHETCPPRKQVLERMKEGPLWVASLDNRIVGTVSVVGSVEGLRVRGMAILPEARGRGIGWLLLEEIQIFAAKKGYRRMLLGTTPFLLRAINLYRNFGFRRCSQKLIEYYGTKIFVMEKNI